MNLDDIPKWLDKDGQEEWKRIVETIKELQLEDIIDRVMLEGYCQAYSQWIKAVKWINKYGEIYKTKSGIIKKSPQVDIADRSMSIIQTFNRHYDLAGRKWYNITETISTP